MGQLLSSRALRRNLEGYTFILPALLGMMIFHLGPMVASAILSLTQYEIVTPPRFIGFDNYQTLFHDELFWRSFFNTVYYVGIGLPLREIVALAVAILLNQKLRGMAFFRTVYYVPSVTAGVAVSILWTYVYDPQFGLMNYMLSKVGIQGPSWLGSPTWAMPALIIMSMWQIGSPMLIYLAGLQSIPTHLYEVAELDGATLWQRFRYITAPLLTPVIFFNVVMGVIGSFQVFTQAYIMTNGGPLNATLVYVMYLYQRGFQWLQMGVGSAMAWILFIILFSLTLLQFKLSSWVYYEGVRKL